MTNAEVTPLDMTAVDGDRTAIGFHFRAIFPEVVHASRLVGSKNLITRRRETRTQVLPPSFRDERYIGAGHNSVEYKISLTAKRIRKGKGQSQLAVPLLFLPFTDTPAPSSSLAPSPSSQHAYDAAPDLLTQSLSAKIRRGMTFDKGIISTKLTIPKPSHVPVGHKLPFSLLVTISAKDGKDIEEGGSIILPSLPLAGAKDLFPTFSIKRIEQSVAGWAEEVATQLYDCNVVWSDGHLQPYTTGLDASQIENWAKPNAGPHGWTKVYKEKGSNRHARAAHLIGTISSDVPPPVNTAALQVDYELLFAWKVNSSIKLSSMVAPWIGSSGVTSSMTSTVAHDSLIRLALGADHSVLMFVADTPLASSSQPATRGAPSYVRPPEDLPSYESGRSSRDSQAEPSQYRDIKAAC